MGDLISRAAAMKAFMVKPPEYYHTSYIVGEINCLPNVDAVPVVRCKDCVHYNTTGCSVGFGWCEDAVVNAGVWDDFYCADGERRA